MPSDRTYRCLSCLEHTESRDFDVSHVSTTCANCGEFGRFVNEAVVEQFWAFESSPPENLEWESLDREQKLFVSERVARTDRSVEAFEVTG